MYGQAGDDVLNIHWLDVLATNLGNAEALGRVYEGGNGIDVFRFYAVPAALPAFTFQNTVDNFVLILGFFGLTDFGFPDTFDRSASLTPP